MGKNENDYIEYSNTLNVRFDAICDKYGIYKSVTLTFTDLDKTKVYKVNFSNYEALVVYDRLIAPGKDLWEKPELF